MFSVPLREVFCGEESPTELQSGSVATNDILAPEEPNVYRPVAKPTTGAPAERNVSAALHSAPPEREHLFELAFYKHCVPPDLVGKNFVIEQRPHEFVLENGQSSQEAT